ncbi:MAG TPA: hypothetical protein VNQ76_06860 [Planctomicrobium sp.]|nr:hypothetical protein [Planctomicrobium sp.]
MTVRNSQSFTLINEYTFSESDWWLSLSSKEVNDQALGSLVFTCLALMDYSSNYQDMHDNGEHETGGNYFFSGEVEETLDEQFQSKFPVR